MAQHDLNIANQSFPSFRSDLNNALSAIQTTHSGTSRPTGAVAGQIWLDTTSATSPTLKYYDGADDISLATIDHSANTVNWLDSTVSITGLATTATGTVLTLTDTHLNSTVSIRIPTTKGIDDDSGNEFLKFTKTATAVNEFTIINSATGSAPEIQSTGDDTNIDLKITPKGTGKIILDGLAFPNADGTASQVLQTNGSGVLSFATPSGGKVLQVVSTLKTDAFSTSSTADDVVITGLSATITPTSASSKILVFSHITVASNLASGMHYRILRNSTGVGIGNIAGKTGMGFVTDAGQADSNRAITTGAYNFLDEPSSTSALTYQAVLTMFNGGVTVRINTNSNLGGQSFDDAFTSGITLIEIGA